MKPELLHPAIVHLPLGIAIVLPVLGLLAVWLHFRRRDESAVFARFWVALMVFLWEL
jgi:threonine/homoserine efflux transporter RhtA